MSCIPCQQAKATLSKGSNIVQGYTNLIFKDEIIEKMALARLEVCTPCKFRKVQVIIAGVEYSTCTKCKCPLDAKVRAPDEVCPKGDW